MHKTIGLILLLPLLCWALTGIVFLAKPGYQGAYENISPKHYPLEGDVTFTPQRGWQELRLVRTILGSHLLVHQHGKARHLDPVTLQAKPLPSDADVRRLINDATAQNRQRYGNIIEVSSGKVTTDTGVEITLDWSTLTLGQQGDDTRLISTLYKIHYLQWTGTALLDKILGGLGIILLIALALLGLTAYVRGRKTNDG